MKHALVITSISEPSPILRALADGAQKSGWPFYLIGDRKTPPGDWTSLTERFYSISAQMVLGPTIAERIPLDNYSRKNIGYLLAMRDGAEVIVETDDDNRPLPEFFDPRWPIFPGGSVAANRDWFNALDYFRVNLIWPRGFPLDEILHADILDIDDLDNNGCNCPIQQALIAGEPDVDAIYRLTHGTGSETDEGDDNEPIPELVLQNSWCPFNSQNTTWFKEAFPLMYIPSYL